MDQKYWNVFLDQFDRVRIKSEPNAKQFGERFNREEAFRIEVRNLRRIVVELDTSLARSKVKLEVSELARDAWREFQHEWRDLIECADEHFDEGFDQEIWGWWKEGARIIRKNGHLYHGLEDYSPGEPFDEKVHNGGKLIEFSRNEFAKYIASKELEQLDETEQNLFQDIRNVFMVIRKVEHDMGADLTRAFRLWARLPPYLLPPAIDLGNKDSIDRFYEVLRDAIRAYVLGAKLSAISLCRALLESILKEFYASEHSTTSVKANKKSPDLEALIYEAKKKHEYLNVDLLHEIRKRANDVLHDSAAVTLRSKKLDEEILSYFKELKRMIDKLPPKDS